MILYKSLPKFDDNSHVHFITTNTYKNYPFFRDERLSEILLEELRFYSGKLGFALVGYVIMPAHVHLLIWWSRDDKQLLNISKIMQVIKGATARKIIDLLRGRSEHLLRPIAIRREQMLSPTRENVSSQYHIRSPKFRLWQPGFYDFNIYSEEKLDYIHNNPVSAGLVLSSGDYEWSSYHLYFSEERKANTAVSAE
ncbi:MAG: transposase [Dehalococcoidia bacterium]|nr:transposase [Dehalococcoidia bacterium]